MSPVMREGYVSLSEASEIFEAALFAGMPDADQVRQLRAEGYDVRSGTERNIAISELWRQVDAKKLQPFAIGTRRGRQNLVPLENTEAIPFLRNPRGRTFAFLRPGSPYFMQLAQQLGTDLSKVHVAFDRKQVQKVAKTCVAARRRRGRASGSTRGRPSKYLAPAPVIRELVEQGKWSPLSSVKELAARVNRRLAGARPVSEDTVTIALDYLYESSRDRRFQRIKRAARAMTLLVADRL